MAMMTQKFGYRVASTASPSLNGANLTFAFGRKIKIEGKAK
jgi:hypothetical protein